MNTRDISSKNSKPHKERRAIYTWTHDIFRRRAIYIYIYIHEHMIFLRKILSLTKKEEQ